VSVGAQYRIPVGSGGAEIIPRADLAYTSELYTSVFNDRADRVSGYAIVNAQVQLNLADERYYLRGFVRNLTNNNAITGQYLGDQSLGLFTNVFTLEPRQYGIAAGFKF
jgi:iron complex outermembrane recepter protein